MITLGTSSYEKLAGKETRWIPGDDKTKYNDNMKKNLHLMQLNGWDGARGELTYKINSDGFRADEFSNEPSVMFLGCSMTMGVGIELENTWAQMIAKDLGLKNHNLGTGGSNNDAAFRLFNHWHRRYKPELVVYYSPPPVRLEIFYTNRLHIVNLLPNSGDWVNDRVYQMWISTDINAQLNQQKNLLAVEYLCKQSNIPLVWLDNPQMFNLEDESEFISKEFGRDLLHPGNSWHRKMHKRIMSMIQEL